MYWSTNNRTVTPSGACVWPTGCLPPSVSRPRPPAFRPLHAPSPCLRTSRGHSPHSTPVPDILVVKNGRSCLHFDPRRGHTLPHGSCPGGGGAQRRLIVVRAVKLRRIDPLGGRQARPLVRPRCVPACGCIQRGVHTRASGGRGVGGGESGERIGGEEDQGWGSPPRLRAREPSSLHDIVLYAYTSTNYLY